MESKCQRSFELMGAPVVLVWLDAINFSQTNLHVISNRLILLWHAHFLVFNGNYAIMSNQNAVKSTLIFDFCGYFLLSWNCLTEVLFLLVKLITLVSISISFQIFNCLWAVKYLLICGFFLFCFNEQEHQVCDL